MTRRPTGLRGWVARRRGRAPDRLLVVFKLCAECGGTVACFPKDPAPRTCKEHT